ALMFLPRPASLIMSVVAVTGLGTLWQHPDALFQDRSFFGTHKVLDLPGKGVRAYVNGTTAHGYLDLSELEAQTPTPLSYYHPNGPMAEVLTSDHLTDTASVGIVGLGVGALSCYRQPGQDWHFYEIDPMVDRVARNRDLFTYMSNCAGDAPTHLGDARVVLDGQTDLRFDVLVIDAYSSNSVPVHLTTADAMQLYMDRLADDGVLLYHISNRYYRIDVPLARAADALNLDIWVKFHEAKARASFEGDTFVAMVTRVGQTPQTILDNGGWTRLDSDGGKVWTDDFANPLGSLKWIYDR
ncbi:MAG: fused MFS/spermidine synthase, partial [Pseudomonadota bacterium]